MRSTRCLALAAGLLLSSAVTAAGAVSYPPTRIDGTTDVYHGVKVEDPYRWLEHDVRESDDVRQWVKAQNKVTFLLSRDHSRA